MPTDKRKTDRDIEDFHNVRTRHIPKGGHCFFVENEQDYNERNAMQYMREVYGLSGTAFFSPVQVFAL